MDRTDLSDAELIERHARAFHVRSLNARCDHERSACNDASGTIRRLAVALSAPRPLEVGEGEVTEAAFHEAYKLGFLEGYECIQRYDPRDPDYRDDALRSMDGLNEAWSDYKSNMLAVSPAGQRGECREGLALDPALALRAKPASGLDATRCDQGEREAVLRAIDSCGGTHAPEDTESGFARGYDAALAAAEREVKRLFARLDKERSEA